MVLLAEDGTIIPLLSDDASRALFLDERLRNCRSEIQGRRFAGVPYLQVVSFKVERDGRLANSRVLLRRLRDQRALPADLPVLSRPHGAAHAARSTRDRELPVERGDEMMARRVEPSPNGRSTECSFSVFRAADGVAEGGASAMSAADGANLLLGLVAVVAVVSTLGGMACLFWVTRGARGMSTIRPPVTIFKPLKGLDEELELNLRSFFQLDYPCYQLLFCVADAERPGHRGRAASCSASFPATTPSSSSAVRPSGSIPRSRAWPRWNAHRKHDVILISDSNVRVRPSYLRETACYLAEPGVGLVSNLFAGVGEVHAGAVLENLQLNGFIAGGVAGAAVCGATCVVGKSMLMPVRALEAIGGFAAVRNLLAEDQVIGVRVRKAGYSIRLSHHVIENVNRAAQLPLVPEPPFALVQDPPADGACRRSCSSRRPTWRPSAWSGRSRASRGSPGADCSLLVGLGMVRDAVQTRRLRGSFPKLRHLLYSPVKDILLLPLWFDAIVNRRVQWRGHRFLVGRMTRLRLARVPRQVRRRVRRVRRFRTQNPRATRSRQCHHGIATPLSQILTPATQEWP